MVDYSRIEIHELADSVKDTFKQIDKNRNGSLSEDEIASLSDLEHASAKAFLLENYDEITGLEKPSWFSSKDQINKNDLAKLSELAYQTELDRKFFQSAKDYLLEHRDEVDENGDGLLSAHEVENYRMSKTLEHSDSEKTVLDYFSRRLNGNYENNFYGENDNRIDTSFFSNSVSFENLESMDLSNRIEETQKHVMSESMIKDWQLGSHMTGLAVGVAIGVGAAATGPGAFVGAIVGAYIGTKFGLNLGTHIGLNRMDNYYERKHKSTLNNLF